MGEGITFKKYLELLFKEINYKFECMENEDKEKIVFVDFFREGNDPSRRKIVRENREM